MSLRDTSAPPDPSPTRRASTGELRQVAPRRSVRGHLADVARYRELLGQLVRRDLKVRYKNSTLGFAWSMVNPLFLMTVYWIVFSILGVGFEHFAIWLMCGLLVWNLVAGGLNAGTASITSNAFLVGKVNFPREVLPLSTIGAAVVNYLLQTTVFVVVLAIVRQPVDWSYVWLLPIALVTIVMLCAALTIGLSALNVYARDTQYLLELALLGWFWLTPILYEYNRMASWFASHDLPSGLALLNPLTSVVITFQRALYGQAEIVSTTTPPDGTTTTSTMVLLPDGSPLWYLRNLGIVLAVSIVLLALAIRLFDRAEGNFAEVM